MCNKRDARKYHQQNAPRFYAVVKDCSPDPKTPRKRKTRHSSNPPIEHHVGWVMDSKEHHIRTTSIRQAYKINWLFKLCVCGGGD